MTPPRKPTLALAATLLICSASPLWAGGWIGITVQPPEGVQVGEILKDAPADKAGLQKKDVLIKVDGQSVTSISQFQGLINAATPGKEIVLTLTRKGEEREIRITPDESQNHPSMFPEARPSSPPGGDESPREKVWRRSGDPWQGQVMPPMEPQPPGGQPSEFPHQSMQNPAMPGGPMAPPGGGYVSPHQPPPDDPPEPPPTAWLGVAPELTRGGVSLTRIAPGGPGERAGMKLGDTIVSVNGQSISSPRAMSRVLRGFKPGDLVEVTINRNGQMIDIQAQLAAPPAEAP